MLERQPSHVQRLLLRTSLLDRVNGESADLLTDATGSARILLDLEDANAFVVALDPGRTWFRYHHMFGDLLRLELRRTLPGNTPELHRLAARWFAEHAQTADAVRHLQAVGDWAEAAHLLADRCCRMPRRSTASSPRSRHSASTSSKYAESGPGSRKTSRSGRSRHRATPHPRENVP
ncbi:hypothetical protein [Streptomyces sp. NPDC101455]|uniref:hypothetical protein n=1 Tax=Streptomyces sp. NPDC101455 TaxID=3366142 RepID=UPI003808BA66